MSKTYIGAIATLVAALGILTEAEAVNVLNAIILLATTGVTLYGRYKAGGITVFGGRM